MKCNQIICENNHTHKFQDGKKPNWKNSYFRVFFSQLKLLLMIDILRVIWVSKEIGV